MIVLAGIALVLIYVLAVGSWTAWDFGLAAALASTGLLRFRQFVLPHPASGLRGNVVRALRCVVLLTVGLAIGFAGGTLRVLRALLVERSQPGFVEVPFDGQSEAAMAASALVATITPDTFLADVDYGRRVMIFHAIDARDADAVRRRIQQMHVKFVAPLFP